MIRGDKIDLRLVREDELETFSELMNDVENNGEFWPSELTSLSTLHKRFEENGLWGERFGTLVICDKDDRIVGEIVWFKTLDYMEEFEIGYRIFLAEDRGRGATSEALALMTRYLFTYAKVNRLRLMIDCDNGPSQRVAEKCGYLNEGRTRGCMMLRGEYRDMYTYSILRKEVLNQDE